MTRTARLVVLKGKGRAYEGIPQTPQEWFMSDEGQRIVCSRWWPQRLIRRRLRGALSVYIDSENRRRGCLLGMCAPPRRHRVSSSRSPSRGMWHFAGVAGVPAPLLRSVPVVSERTAAGLVDVDGYLDHNTKLQLSISSCVECCILEQIENSITANFFHQFNHRVLPLTYNFVLLCSGNISL